MKNHTGLLHNTWHLTMKVIVTYLCDLSKYSYYKNCHGIFVLPLLMMLMVLEFLVRNLNKTVTVNIRITITRYVP